MMIYTPEDIEFAIRMLHHRKELDSHEVTEWMKDPAHLELLEEMAAIRTISGDMDGNEQQEHRRMQRRIFRGQRIAVILAIAASVMVALGIWWLERNPFRNTEQERIVAQSNIEPGNSKARLILPDGKIVDLFSHQRGLSDSLSRIFRNDSVEGLKYHLKRSGVVSGEYHMLQVPRGGFYKLELSDGTKVWLNSGTELRYPVVFAGKERKVYLKGEGYFQVAQDKERPFEISLEQARVTVLGTSFNVSAYPEEEKILTTLVKGSICFHAEKSGKEVLMTPGEQCSMDIHEGDISLRQVDTEIYTAWIEGRFVFRDLSLEAIMRQLERWYDFQIIYAQPGIKEKRFQGVIQRDSKIEDVFRAIEWSMDVKFYMEGKQVIVSKNKP